MGASAPPPMPAICAGSGQGGANLGLTATPTSTPDPAPLTLRRALPPAHSLSDLQVSGDQRGSPNALFWVQMWTFK